MKECNEAGEAGNFDAMPLLKLCDGVRANIGRDAMGRFRDANEEVIQERIRVWMGL